MSDFKCTRQGECFGRRPNGYCDVMTLSPNINRPCPFQKPKRFRKKDGSKYDFPDRQYIVDGSGK
ncbi:MAG: hypothetical protein IIY57_01740, partial [Erysipelotrichaceae bacterium]|nr:hypothetical protein [Erysipelotrichaceae bacterium]